MTPKQAYDNISSRARRLLRFHDGLVNTRARGIRSDWKTAFCKLMHWPRQSAIDRIDSRDAMIVLRNGSGLSADDFTSDAVDDLLRSSLAVGVSALDRYVHERVVRQVVTSLRGSKLRSAPEKLSIPAILALRMTDELRRAQRAGEGVRPANQLRIALQEALHRRTFQSWREIEDAFELIGVSGLTASLKTAYGVANLDPIKEQLDTIVQRRHQIVHESDLVRHQRGGQPRVHPITKKNVHDSLDFFDQFVNHLEEMS